MIDIQHVRPRLALLRLLPPQGLTEPEELERAFQRVRLAADGKRLVLVVDVRLAEALEPALARRYGAVFRRLREGLELMIVTHQGSQNLTLQLDQMARRLPGGAGVLSSDRAATLTFLETILPASELQAVAAFFRNGDAEQRSSTRTRSGIAPRGNDRETVRASLAQMGLHKRRA